MPRYCFLCRGNHSPNSKECPRNKLEQAVVEVANDQHISIGSAKRQVLGANKDPSSTYALAVKMMKTANNRNISDNSRSSNPQPSSSSHVKSLPLQELDSNKVQVPELSTDILAANNTLAAEMGSSDST